MFFILLISLCFLYRYQDIIRLRPTSIHQHRQCDCLSFAYNYYKCNNNFFESQINYKTGKNFEGKVTSEFPILPFLVAQLWKLFGYHEWLYRLVVILIMFAGFLSLFSVFRHTLENNFWSTILTLWLFSSPILIYYGNNFLADVPALSFAFIGWYFFSRCYRNHRLPDLILTFIFFCLAMLLKLTAGISFVALAILFLAEYLKKDKSRKPVFQKPLITFVLFLFVILVVCCWYLYAVLYNRYHLNPDEAQLFLTGILPIWNLSYENIIRISRIIIDYQSGNYFNLAGLLIIFIFFIINLLNYKKQNRFLMRLNILIFVAVICGILLWFQVYDDHDYYLINYLPFIPITCLTFFHFIKTEYPQLFHSLKLKIPILLVVLFCIYWGYAKTEARYAGAGKEDYEYSALLSRHEVEGYKYMHWIYPQERQSYETITPYLRSLGITEKDPVFSFPDPSTNITLYLMGQWGVPIKKDNGAELLKYFDYYKDLHIKYFILGDSTLLHDAIIKRLLSKKIGQYGTVSIYDIGILHLSYQRILCDAETLDKDNAFFKGSPEQYKYGNVQTRSNERSYDGTYSVKLGKSNKYGFSTKIPIAGEGQIINVSVWRYAPGESSAGICLSAESPDDLYIFNPKTESGATGGWQKISTQITMPEKMYGKDLSVYVFNPAGEDDVYFDDFEITVISVPE